MYQLKFLNNNFSLKFFEKLKIAILYRVTIKRIISQNFRDPKRNSQVIG